MPGADDLEDLVREATQLSKPANSLLEVHPARDDLGRWWIDVHVPGGHGSVIRVADDDTAWTLVVRIRRLVQTVLDAERRRPQLLQWREQGDPRWQVWATAARIEFLQRREIDRDEIARQLQIDGPASWAQWQQRIARNPGLTLAALWLERQPHRNG